MSATADQPSPAQRIRELRRSAVRVSVVNLTLVLLVVVSNWSGYPLPTRALLVAAVLGCGAVAVWLTRRSTRLLPTQDAASAGQDERRRLRQLARLMLGSLLLSQGCLVALTTVATLHLT